jgi:hypothetical protein
LLGIKKIQQGYEYKVDFFHFQQLTNKITIF